VAPNLSVLPSSPRAARGLARFLPTATIVAAAILALLPLPVPGYAALTPSFALMAVYHWSVYRPDLLPASGLFAIGFAQDLLSGATIPASALLLLLARAAVLRYRRHFVGRPFPFVWAGFAALAFAAMLGSWALHCLLHLTLFDLRTAIIRGAVTVALFPAASLILGRSQRALIGAAA
jgi:rod shape-determining protein MreD